MNSIFGFSVENDSRGEVASINGKILPGEEASVYNVGIARVVVSDSRMVAPNC
jgi:hypothetical protein